jgi:hypothetical protein
MSPSPSGPFQSKVLGFLVQKAHRFIDKYERAVRHAKIATVWGTQILLYPIYALLQTTRLVGRQLQHRVDRGLPRLPWGWRSPQLPPADTPIQRVLEAVNAVFEKVANADSMPTQVVQPLQNLFAPVRQTSLLEKTVGEIRHWIRQWQSPQPRSSVKLLTGHQPLALPELIDQTPQLVPLGQRLLTLGRSLVDWGRSQGGLVVKSLIALATQTSRESVALSRVNPDSVATANRIKIQGIASLLASHHLVLVAPDNQILDILTLTQQRQLYERMIWEMADYWRQWRISHLSGQRFLAPLPVLDDRPHLLPPVRLLRKLMSWLQTSPVAVATNLFQESQWVSASTASLILKPAQLEATIASPQPALPHSWTWLNSLLRTSDPTPPPVLAPAGHPADPWSPIAAQVGNLATPKRRKSPDALRERTVNPETQALPASQVPSGVPRQQNLLFQWLQMPAVKDDRPRSPIVPTGRNRRTQIQKTHQPSAASEVSPVESPLPLSPAMATAAVSVSASSTQELSASTPSSTENWIETQATVVGYVKHPLERLLEWVDRALLWLERLITRIWQWFTHR